jgi:hypothetical protein
MCLFLKKLYRYIAVSVPAGTTEHHYFWAALIQEPVSSTSRFEWNDWIHQILLCFKTGAAEQRPTDTDFFLYVTQYRHRYLYIYIYIYMSTYLYEYTHVYLAPMNTFKKIEGSTHFASKPLRLPHASLRIDMIVWICRTVGNRTIEGESCEFVELLATGPSKETSSTDSALLSSAVSFRHPSAPSISMGFRRHNCPTPLL